MNISIGTMMILHCWRVNQAAAFITAAATLIFLQLQQRARIENAATLQHIQAAILSISGLVHSSQPYIPSLLTTMQPTPNPISPAMYKKITINTMQLPQVLIKVSKSRERTKLEKIAISDIFQVTLRSLITLSQQPSPVVMYWLSFQEMGKHRVTIFTVSYEGKWVFQYFTPPIIVENWSEEDLGHYFMHPNSEKFLLLQQAKGQSQLTPYPH